MYLKLLEFFELIIELATGSLKTDFYNDTLCLCVNLIYIEKIIWLICKRVPRKGYKSFFGASIIKKKIISKGKDQGFYYFCLNDINVDENRSCYM